MQEDGWKEWGWFTRIGVIAVAIFGALVVMGTAITVLGVVFLIGSLAWQTLVLIGLGRIVATGVVGIVVYVCLLVLNYDAKKIYRNIGIAIFMALLFAVGLLTYAELSAQGVLMN